jgi:hypothetical protein
MQIGANVNIPNQYNYFKVTGKDNAEFRGAPFYF